MGSSVQLFVVPVPVFFFFGPLCRLPHVPHEACFRLEIVEEEIHIEPTIEARDGDDVVVTAVVCNE